MKLVLAFVAMTVAGLAQLPPPDCIPPNCPPDVFLAKKRPPKPPKAAKQTKPQPKDRQQAQK